MIIFHAECSHLQFILIFKSCRRQSAVPGGVGGLRDWGAGGGLQQKSFFSMTNNEAMVLHGAFKAGGLSEDDDRSASG